MLKQRLREHLDQFNVAPFLFVGSGLSIRYLGLENWENLLRRFSQFTHYEYEYFKSTANSNLPKVATEIASEFHPMWWKDERYKENRNTYKKEAINNESALKIEIASYIRERSKAIQESEDLKFELQLLKKATIDGIITTNWDLLLESLFSEFEVYIGQDNLLFSNPKTIAEIYKIHGCCTLPNSLILTEGDYNKFQKRNPYLVSKLLTIFVEHPIVFLGYSLTDTNIVQLLGSIANCLTSENLEKLRNRLIFVQYDRTRTSEQLEYHTIVVSGYHIQVRAIYTNTFRDIFEVLSERPRYFPAKLLRQLKEHIYELVKTNEPKSSIYVQDIEDETDYDNVEVVLGIGVANTARTQLVKEAIPSELGKKGYQQIERAEIMLDVVQGGNKYDSSLIIQDVLPKLLALSPYTPIFKYLRESSLLDKEGKLISNNLHSRILTKVKIELESFKPNNFSSIDEEYGELKHMLSREGPEYVARYGTHLNLDYLSVKQLRDYLTKHTNLLVSENYTIQFGFRKLICLYDYLHYKKQRVF